jgi:hypothetical protein
LLKTQPADRIGDPPAIAFNDFPGRAVHRFTKAPVAGRFRPPTAGTTGSPQEKRGPAPALYRARASVTCLSGGKDLRALTAGL